MKELKPPKQNNYALSIPKGLLEYTALPSLVVLLITTIFSNQLNGLDKIRGFFSIPDILQLVSAIFLALIIVVYPWKHVSATKQSTLGKAYSFSFKSRLYSVTAIAILLSIFAVFDDTFASISFRNNSILTDTNEPERIERYKEVRKTGIDGRIRELFKLVEMPENPDIPSGFALRQGIITILAIFFVCQGMLSIKSIQRVSIIVMYILILIYVVFSRIVLKAHSPLAIGAALPIGTIVSFSLIYAMFILQHIPIRKGQFRFFANFSMIIFITYIIISNSPAFWIILGIVLGLLLSYVFDHINNSSLKEISE